MFDAADCPPQLPPADLVIDAAYGTGFHGEWKAPRVGATPVLAVDIPSGVDGLTGEAGRGVLAADRTVTFAALKPGLLLGAGRILAGDVEVVDIGLDTRRARAQLVEAEDVARWWRPRPPTAHKWIRAVRVVAGSPGMTGAAHLASAAAMRAGSGMVSLSTPGTDGSAPEEVVRRRLPAFDWSSQVLDDLHRYHALVVGPGLGREPYTVAAVRATAIAATVPARRRRRRAVRAGVGRRRRRAVLHRRTSPTVLTPHDGEYGLLAGHRPAADRFLAARRLAADLRTRRAAEGSDHGRRRARRRRARRRQRRRPAGHRRHRRRAVRDPRRPAGQRASIRSAPRRRRRGCTPRRPARARPTGLVAGDIVDALPARAAGGCRERRRRSTPRGRGPRSTSTPSPTTSACCARRPRRPACGRSSRPTATGTAPSPSGAAALDAGCDGLCVALTAEGVALRRGRHRRADPRAQRAAARARRGDRRPRPDADGHHASRRSTRWPRVGATGLGVHVKVDTGMHRVGAAPADVPALVARIAAAAPACGWPASSPTSPSPTSSTTRTPPASWPRSTRCSTRWRRTCWTASSSTPPTRPAASPIPAPAVRSCAPASPCTGSRPVPASTTSPPSCGRCCRCGRGCRSSSGWRPGSRLSYGLRHDAAARRRRGDGAARLRRRRAPRAVATSVTC